MKGGGGGGGGGGARLDYILEQLEELKHTKNLFRLEQEIQNM